MFVREIKGTRASGAARWLTPTKGLVQLSLRHKTDDHLWFSFFHEAAHLLLHSKKATFVSGSGDQDEELEQQANHFSASLLIPKQFEAELLALHSLPEIEAFSQRVGIAPGIVVGQLQNEGHLDWSRGNRLKRRPSTGRRLTRSSLRGPAWARYTCARRRVSTGRRWCTSRHGGEHADAGRSEAAWISARPGGAHLRRA